LRKGKELVVASKEFACENSLQSWFETLITLLLLVFFLSATFVTALPLAIRLLCSFFCSLSYVRIFVIYHDYQHCAILKNSGIARVLMQAVGIYMLAPQNIWKRSHEHHHNNNSKLTISGIGSYPTISKKRFLTLTQKERMLYLANRHPLTVIFGYFTLFVYWLNMKSFIQSPQKHLDSLAALLLHITAGVLIWAFFGAASFFISWFIPFFLAFGIGSYLFYCQHNFPAARFCEDHDWKYDNAALCSTSFMVMDPVMQWFTGNIGYHHVHHLNSRIPFYRLSETMKNMPELNGVSTTSWNLLEVIRCFRLKLWDEEIGKMITLSQLKKA
jgi:omega-6 fatty acid desaturase (delta-12 desaturase)